MTAFSILLADGATRTVFQWGRIQSPTDWILPLGVCAAIGLFVRAMYRRDAVELRPALSWLLTALRLAAFLGLLILYLQPQWRMEHEVTRNSRALVLIDTSSSMGLIDDERRQDADGSEPTRTPKTTRLGQVTASLGQSDFLDRLRRTHDVVVLRCDEDVSRIAELDKRTPGARVPGESENATVPFQSLSATGAQTRLGDALRKLIDQERSLPTSAIVLLSDGCQNAGGSVEAAVQAAREAGIPIFPVGVGADRLPSNVRVYTLDAPPRAYPGDPYTVTALVQVQGSGEGETGAGDGSLCLPLTVQLLVRETSSTEAAAPSESRGESLPTGTLVESREVVVGDGVRGQQTLPVTFEITPHKTGRQRLCVRVVAARDDHNPNDDFQEAEVEVVDRQDRVLLFAGGPTREYRFLRTLLYRDASMTVDVLLETAAPGVSQEADAILDHFPSSREEMLTYDCLVAVDPDWRALSQAQIYLLDAWVADSGGGMIAIAGPIHAGDAVTGWVQQDGMEKIRALYPVEFQRRESVFESGVRAGTEPWPLDFTREGLDAEYLGLDDDPVASLRAWAAFPGVYSYCPVRGPKPAATVLARFSDPRARQGDDGPVYFAEQFYGSGRVFYLGSGEMWRLRRVDERCFERFYTRLIRHVAQGRLLRQSSRGVLMVGQDSYALGHSVEIRAQLTSPQGTPLDVAQVDLDVFLPDGGVETVALRPDPTRAGTYAGQFTVLQEGSYRLELPVPGATAGRDHERMTRRIQVTMPDLERQNPRRNGKLLAEIAAGSGGKYYDSLSAALGSGGTEPLAERLRDRTRTVILTAAPDPVWEETWLRWMMIGLASLLCLEWLIRRLNKLA